MTSPGSNIIQLNIGDTVPLGTVLANLILMGIVTDINNPNMFAATLEAFQDQAVLTLPILQGPQGDPGQPSFALRWQNDNLTTPSQLPTDLTDLVGDLGKFWVFAVTDNNGNVVATTMYVWWGTRLGFKQLPVGAPGPPGPYPVITPNLKLEVPGSGNGPGGVDSWVAVQGPASNPVMTFHVAAPQGLPGPSAALGSCPDIDFTTNAPAAGDLLQCTARLTPGAPTNLGITASNTGGSFLAGQYFWKITATTTSGETMPSNEVTATFAGSTSSATITWTAPTGGGATGFKVYRGTVIGGENILVAIITNGSTTSYTDTGGSGTPASPPSTGVVAGRNIWVPITPGAVYGMKYTVPEAAFTSIQGIGAATQTVCTFAVPQQAFKWKPWVLGQMQIFGANISFTPLLVGAEVRLNDPQTGPIVARGFGNSLGYVTLIPHASDNNNTSNAITPTNAYALVQANHTGTQGTLYVTLVNQGMAGVYDFNSANAQLSVEASPVPQ